MLLVIIRTRIATSTITIQIQTTYGNRDEEHEDEEAVLEAAGVGGAAEREAAHHPGSKPATPSGIPRFLPSFLPHRRRRREAKVDLSSSGGRAELIRGSVLLYIMVQC